MTREISISPTSSRSCCLDPEAMAAIALQEDAKASRKMAREARKDSQRDKIVLMRQAAGKLREMASNALSSAFWQGAFGIASATCSAIGGIAGHRGATLTADLGKTASDLCGTVSRVDPFQVMNQYLSADKAELDVRAEVAGNRAGEQADLESEARRLEGAAAQQLQKLGDARHAIAIAALKV